MSDERIRIDLERAGDRWAADLERLGDEAAQRVIGSGPGEVLEQVGQYLDAREARRLTREHGLQDVFDYCTAGLPEDGPAYRLTRDAGGRERVDLVDDDERVLEVLDDRRGEWLDVDVIAAAAGFNVARTVLALERLLAAIGDVDRDGDRWRLMGSGR